LPELAPELKRVWHPWSSSCCMLWRHNLSCPKHKRLSWLSL